MVQRTRQMAEYHEWQLSEIERMIGKGMRRKDIAATMGLLPPRVSGLARELKVQGRIPWERPDQLAALVELTKVVALCAAEERAKL